MANEVADVVVAGDILAPQHGHHLRIHIVDHCAGEGDRVRGRAFHTSVVPSRTRVSG
jgi:hypothetical protein